VVALGWVNGGGASRLYGKGDQFANEPWNATEWYQLQAQLLTASTEQDN
jgi:hypothetical protein